MDLGGAQEPFNPPVERRLSGWRVGGGPWGGIQGVGSTSSVLRNHPRTQSRHPRVTHEPSPTHWPQVLVEPVERLSEEDLAVDPVGTLGHVVSLVRRVGPEQSE